MKWIKLLKYPMQAMTMLIPLLRIACFITIGIYCSFPLNIILIVLFAWVVKNDEIPFWFGWKKEHHQKFFKNWNDLCEGKTHEETRNGEEWIVIDSEE